MPGAGGRRALETRAAGPADLDAVAETLALAFYEDPVWGWAFPDPEQRLAQHRAHWRLLSSASVEDGSTWVTEGVGAAAVWIAPGRPELSPEDEAGMAPFVESLVGEDAPRVLETMERFGAAHPDRGPHYYLSLLGTHPDHRGQGEGMGLLADCLTRIDAEGAAAYLESTNPANERRYEGQGFVTFDSFELAEDGPPVTQMWREPRPSG
jgi:GNAT superfamily N-acetyltransferase